MAVPGSPSRDVLLAGMHGERLGWTRNVLTDALQRTYGSVIQLPMDGGPPAVEDACARLFVGDLISEPWAEAVRSGELPAVLVIDDIPWACHHLVQAGLSEIEVIRTLVSVATALGDLHGTGRVMTLPEMLAFLGAPEAVFPARDEDPVIPLSLRPLIDSVVTSAFQFAASGRRLSILWPSESLFWGDRPGEAMPRVLDMTGPARVLAYGPYYTVPSGRWIVRATLAFSPSSRGAPLALELHGPTGRLGRFEFAAEQPGIFAASFPVVVASARDPLEIRLCTERGAIEGTLGFDRVELIPEQDQSVA